MIKKNLKTLAGTVVLALSIIGINTTATAQPFCRSGFAGTGEGTCLENGNTYTANRQAARQVRADAVIEKLNLDEKQKEAWNSFQATIAAQLKAMQERRAISLSSMSTLDRIEKRQQFVREDSNLMMEHLEALKTFYLTLTPKQQQILDTEIGLGRGFGYRQGHGNRYRHGRSEYNCDGTCY